MQYITKIVRNRGNGIGVIGITKNLAVLLF